MNGKERMGEGEAEKIRIDWQGLALEVEQKMRQPIGSISALAGETGKASGRQAS